MEETQTFGTVVRRFLLLGLLVVTFLASAMVTIYALFQSGEVKVPNVVGMTEQDAERAVLRAGLHYKLRRQHFDSDAPSGSVTDQDPVAGFPVKVGFDVKIDVSKGPDPTGRSDEPPPPGPTNPVDGPAENANQNKNRNKNKNSNTNGNANVSTATNANVNKPKVENKNADGKSVKSDEPGAVKPKPDAEAPPPKPKPKTPAQVPPHV